MKRKAWGFILLVLGILVLLQVTGLYELGLSFWPVVLLLLGATILWESISHKFISWVPLALGLWVGGIGLFGILSNAEVSTLTGNDIARYGWPLILVAIGLSIILGERSCSLSRIWGKWSGDDDLDACTRMHHIGDLYHGRSHWVLDRDYNFHHGMGDVVIDLTTAQIMPGNYKIYVKAGIGEVTVRVPDGINVEVEASVGLGELDVFGEQRSGIGGLSLQKEIMLPQAEATVKIEAKLGMGELTISYIPAIPGVIR
jgi:lia operon protein LiaF